MLILNALKHAVKSARLEGIRRRIHAPEQIKYIVGIVTLHEKQGSGLYESQIGHRAGFPD